MTAQEFRLPDIGEGLVEAEIVRWLVPVGGHVAADEAVVEVETAKAVTDIPCPFAGTVIHHGAAAGEVIEVGKTLVVIGDPDDAWPAGAGDGLASRASENAAPIVGTLVEEAQDVPPIPPPPIRDDGRPPAMPLVRKLAKELGVDLQQVTGTGTHGRITRQDVEAAAAHQEPTASRSSEDGEPPAARPTRLDQQTGDERRPLSRLRRTIAANMTRSWAEIPQVTAFDEVDATRLLALRTVLRDRHQVPVPLDALVVAAVVPALRAVPVFNSSLDGDDLVVHGRHDVGVAVDTPDGLIVTVLRHAGSKGVLDLAAEILRLGEAARSRTLKPTEASGQTFTISNIGAAGGSYGTPIVPPETVGILSVGRATERPVARDGQIEIAPVMPLSLSYDHRVADGADGRRFLAMIVENLTEPALLLA